MMRDRRWITLTVALGLSVLAACGGTPAASTPTATTPATGAPGGSPTAGPASPTATPGTPVASPTATPPPATGALIINGARADQVVVPTPASDAMYAVTADGLYRRASGQNWTKVSGPISGQLLADPTNPDVLYQGDHPPCAKGGESVPFQKSTDGGKTWQTIAVGQDIRPLNVDPANPSRLYGESCASLAISTDAGQTWNKVQPVPSFDISALALAGTTLYGIYTSEGGTSWLVPTDISNPAQPVAGDRLLEFWGGGSVAATTERIIVGEPHGVHISTDGGKTWSFSRTGLEKVTLSVDALTQPIPQPEISQGFGIFAVASDPRNTQHIFAGSIRGLYQSQDGGKTWTLMPQVGEIRVNALTIALNGAALYATTEEGVVVANP